MGVSMTFVLAACLLLLALFAAVTLGDSRGRTGKR